LVDNNDKIYLKTVEFNLLNWRMFCLINTVMFEALHQQKQSTALTPSHRSSIHQRNCQAVIMYNTTVTRSLRQGSVLVRVDDDDDDDDDDDNNNNNNNNNNKG